ncbi:hypothetical protein QJS10_CPA02g00042 [Acorus calamus]|uniref:SCP domain-containing protein n=1 Tax=Acorus calamus TaxID=4465 RepID=A0AAV9FD10_ACOCL|nr:hypothetical protein QJS10_CPA02g00042 [Acorus calamus]
MSPSNNHAALAMTCIVSLCMAQMALAQNTQHDYLHTHNTARAEVGVGALTWDDTLEAYAHNYAKIRSGDCQLIHSHGPYGENIYYGYGKGYQDGADAVRFWLDEKDIYDHDGNACVDGQDCLHYTQIVWRGTRRVGCARAQCDNGDFFVTCNYSPPGNVVGERPY